jgi:hypothetical protein
MVAVKSRPHGLSAEQAAVHTAGRPERDATQAGSRTRFNTTCGPSPAMAVIRSGWSLGVRTQSLKVARSSGSS